MHFPRDGAAGSRALDEEFFEQLTREKLVTRRQGYTEWDKSGRREVGVCWVYAYVAVCGLPSQHALFLEIGRAPPARDEDRYELRTSEDGVDVTASVEPENELDPARAVPVTPVEPTSQPLPTPPAPAPWLAPRHSAFGGATEGGWMNRRRD